MILIIKLLVICLLILLIGFFTSSETAYLSLPKLKLRSMVDQEVPRAKLVQRLKENMGRLLTTLLIGTNFFNSLASAMATAIAIELLGPKGTGIAPFIVAFFITTFGQIIPKTSAGLNPQKFTCRSAVALSIIEKIFFPVIWIFETLSKIVVKLVNLIIKNPDSFVTEEELKVLIDVGQAEGTIEKDEGRMMNKIIKFNDLQVSDIMKYRSFVSMVNENADYNEVVQEFLHSGFSSIAVYNESEENITGVLNYEKVLYSSEKTNQEEGFAGRMMENVMYVPGTFSVIELLQKFREVQNKFAVVLNEQGQTSGIVTMEDITRSVFGRMTDVKSTDALAPELRIKPLSATSFIVPGDLQLDAVNEILKLELESEDMNTVGGWLLEQFGFLPSSGSAIVRSNILFVAEEVQNRRIVTIKIKKM